MQSARVALAFGMLLIFLTDARTVADDWPQWGGPQRDCVWHEDGIVKVLPTSELLPRKWSTPIAEGYSDPRLRMPGLHHRSRARTTARKNSLPERRDRRDCLEART